MRIHEYLEPLPIHPGHESLGRVVQTLGSGTPIAIEEAGRWRLLRPVDALAFPTSRQLRDLPTRDLPMLRLSQELDLSALAVNDVWGATKNGALVGRIDSLRVVSTLAATATRDADLALATQARERLMPKLLHDLANALTIACTARQLAAAQCSTTGPDLDALDHAGTLVAHMRTFYGAAHGPVESAFDLADLLRHIEPMLRVAASPATLSIDCARSAQIRCQRWRLESALLNLVLNASELAEHIVLRVELATARKVEIFVEDDGPGFGDAQPRKPTPWNALHGHGIPSIRRQVAMIGGSVRLGRSRLGGALVVLRLPCAD